MATSVVNENNRVGSPIYSITYNGKNISKTLAPYINSIVFEDTVEGESSSVEIECENTEMLFSNGWYPEKGATLTLKIADMDCGEFEMDEVELKGPPHAIVMKGLTNVAIKRAMKTKRTRGHSKKSLAQIAQSVADANNLTVFGTVPNILIDRCTQRQETDLKFLRRKAWDFGIIFSVRAGQLVFTSLQDLEKRAPALSLDKTQLTNYSIKDKTDKTFKSTTVRSHNPLKRQNIQGNSQIETLQNADAVNYTQIVSDDRQVVHKRAENQQQAEAMADAHHYRANTWVQSGSIDGPGSTLLIAGNNMELTGLGTAGSGVWNLAKVTHTVVRDSSWTFNAEVKRLGTVSKTKQAGKKLTQPNGGSTILTLQNADAVKYTQIVPIDNALQGK